MAKAALRFGQGDRADVMQRFQRGIHLEVDVAQVAEKSKRIRAEVALDLLV